MPQIITSMVKVSQCPVVFTILVTPSHGPSPQFQWLATRGLLAENLSGLAILNAQHFKLILRPDVKVSGATEGDDNTLDGSIGKTEALHPQDKVTPPRKDSHLPSPLHFS